MGKHSEARLHSIPDGLLLKRMERRYNFGFVESDSPLLLASGCFDEFDHGEIPECLRPEIRYEELENLPMVLNPSHATIHEELVEDQRQCRYHRG